LKRGFWKNDDLGGSFKHQSNLLEGNSTKRNELMSSFIHKFLTEGKDKYMEVSNFQQDNQAAKATDFWGKEIKELPHNIQAEQELLGAILINNQALDKVADFLNAEHFFDPLHQRIYSECAKVIDGARIASPVTLKNRFESELSIGELTVPQYLGRLAARATSVLNAHNYGLTIKEAYLSRQLMDVGAQIIHNVSSGEQNGVKQAIEHAQGALDRLCDHGGVGETTQASLADSALTLINELDDPVNYNAVSTSLKDLDKTLGGGWPRGELTIVAARPSVGKSAFAASSMLRTARQGYEVLCFSMEMQKEALAARCLSDITYTLNNPIAYRDILAKNIEDWRVDRLKKAQKDFSEYSLEIDDQRGLTITNIQSRIRSHINKLDRDGRSLDLIVIDHLGKIKAEDYVGLRHLEIGAMTEQLAVIASNFNVAIVVLCQLNRAVEGRDNKRPTLSDLRESGRIEEDANCVIGLHRPAYYLERMKCDTQEDEAFRKEQLDKVKSQFEAIVLKQRNGECRPVDLWCNMPTNSIGNRGRA